VLGRNGWTGEFGMAPVPVIEDDSGNQIAIARSYDDNDDDD